MGGDHRGKFPLCDFIGQYALGSLPHYRVQTVKDLITEEIFRACANSQQHGNLALHSFGKRMYLPFGIQIQSF